MKHSIQAVPVLVVLVMVTTATHVGCNRTSSATSVAPTASPDQSKPVSNVGNVSRPLDSPAGYLFEAPVRLQADGEFIATESPGYACPTMADVDGDGKQDLVVGQFKNGNMMFCRNIAAAGQPPELAGVEWIKTGDERAVVPGVW